MPVRGRKPLKSASERLSEQLAAGEVYEAHQTCCTMYNRTINKGKQHWNGAKLLLLELSKQFLEHGKPLSALELIELYIAEPSTQIGSTTISRTTTSGSVSSVLKTVGGTEDNKSESNDFTYLYQFLGKEKLLELLPLFENGSDEKLTFLRHVNNFASQCLGKSDAEVVNLLVDEFITGSDWPKAVKYISSCNEETILEKYPVILKEWSTSGYQSEKDLFYLRAMLQLLAHNSNQYTIAKNLHSKIVEEIPEFKECPSINFLKLLLDLIQYSSTEKRPSASQKSKLQAYQKKVAAQQHTFQSLIKFYGPFILERDAKLNALLERIGILYFDIQQAQNPMQAMMSSLMGGGGGQGGGMGMPGGMDMSKLMGAMGGMMGK